MPVCVTSFTLFSTDFPASSSSPSFRITVPPFAFARLINKNFVSVFSPDFSLSSAFATTLSADSADSVIFSVLPILPVSPTSVVTLTVPLSSVTVSAAVSLPVFTSRLSVLPSGSDVIGYPPSSAAVVITGEAAVTAAISPARILFRMEDTYFRLSLSDWIYLFLFFIFFFSFF